MVGEAQKEARAAALEEAQKQLQEERTRIEEMVKERIAEERAKNNARATQIASNSDAAQEELLNDPAVRQKLLELASQQFGLPLSELKGAGKPPLDPRVPLLPGLPPLERPGGEQGSREHSGRKFSRGSSRDGSSKNRSSQNRPAGSLGQKVRANTRTCARCKQAFLLTENGPKSCRTHPGKFVPARKKSSRLANVGMQLLGRQDPGGRYRAADDAEATAGKWSCCGATDQSAPGCYFTSHEPGDKMNF
jgi:hypothetical protein